MMDLREQARIRRRVEDAQTDRLKSFAAASGIFLFFAVMVAGCLAWLYVLFHFITKYW